MPVNTDWDFFRIAEEFTVKENCSEAKILTAL